MKKKKTTGRQKMHIRYRTVAVILSALLAFLPISNLQVAAKVAEKQYPAGHGLENQETDLYRWFLVDDKNKSLDSYLQNEKSDGCFRLLLCYYDKSDKGYYYYEADWTKLKYGKSTHYVGGVYGEMTSVAENPQIQIGENKFYTRGALRSFFAKKVSGLSEYDNSTFGGLPKYKLYMPNEKDDAIDVVEPKDDKFDGGKVSLWFTRGNTNSDMWVYDGTGYPCGSRGNETVWKDQTNAYSYYDSNKDYIHSNEWVVGRDGDHKDDKNLPVFQIVNEGEERYSFEWYLPQLVHTSGKDDDAYNEAKVPTKGAFVMSKDYDGRGNYEQEWVLYVGEKVGEVTNVISGQTEKAARSYSIDAPAFIRRDQVLTIQKGNVLYVDNVLILEGRIDNYGLIIVSKNGAIAGNFIKNNTDYKGNIYCNSGDILLKSGGYITVDYLSLQRGSQLKLDGNLYVKNGLDFYNCMVDVSKINCDGDYSKYFNEKVVGKYFPGLEIKKREGKAVTSAYSESAPKTGEGKFIANEMNTKVLYFKE